MANLKLGGKEFDLKFTYMTILQLERHYGKGIGKIFAEIDLENLSTVTTFVWACLKQFKEFSKKTVDDVALAISDALENEEISFSDIGQAVSDAVENSVLLKQAGAVETDGKKK